MRGSGPFEKFADQYDRWFDEHEPVYRAEVAALRTYVPSFGLGLEVGVGTGRFAQPLGVKIGVDPARQMLLQAKARNISVCQALGEHLPFRNNQFDFVLLVTVICFVQSVSALFSEVSRVLKPGGRVILGFIDRASTLGQLYERRKDSDSFYKEATFYTVPAVAGLVQQAGFERLQFSQTIFGLPGEGVPFLDIRDGYGEGAFVVVAAKKRLDG